MASKRLLKKSINNLTYELVSECFTYRHFHPEFNTGINEVIHEVVKTRNELIARVNQAPAEKDALGTHFNQVVTDMKDMVTKLDKLENLKSK
jgi:hypothetical protein